MRINELKRRFFTYKNGVGETVPLDVEHRFNVEIDGECVELEQSHESLSFDINDISIIVDYPNLEELFSYLYELKDNSQPITESRLKEIEHLMNDILPDVFIDIILK